MLLRWLSVLCAVGSLISSVPVARSAEPHIVFLVAESEYETGDTLPAFARDRLNHYRTTFVFEDPQDRNRLVGIEAVNSADALVVSVRRRTLPKEQLDLVRQYVASGKPVIGIRTASHAFSLRNEQPPEGRDTWPEFDRQVFGGNYTNHHGNSLKVTVTVAPDLPAEAAGLLKGIPKQRPFASGGSLYRVSPLAENTTVLMTGQVEGHPSEPVAWTFQRADGGKSFYTSLGHVEDFRGDVLPRLLTNAIEWGLNR